MDELVEDVKTNEASDTDEIPTELIKNSGENKCYIFYKCI